MIEDRLKNNSVKFYVNTTYRSGFIMGGIPHPPRAEGCQKNRGQIGLTDNGYDNKIAKGTKNSVIKQEVKFKDYENFPEAIRLGNEIKYLE